MFALLLKRGDLLLLNFVCRLIVLFRDNQLNFQNMFIGDTVSTGEEVYLKVGWFFRGSQPEFVAKYLLVY